VRIVEPSFFILAQRIGEEKVTREQNFLGLNQHLDTRIIWRNPRKETVDNIEYSARHQFAGDR
jgi:hypothetical protein